ncbi:lanthionine synthetase LanC family protein [Nostoc sp. MG11]|uniref:lanthionine synthetase LanC family protein n=1 Tax=Nostoc sp. MG11 TaxID=2721166 RepID=UPI001D024917|nr:lanthionine synthetase LanC family protein [Nostoc sp. MG11]
MLETHIYQETKQTDVEVSLYIHLSVFSGYFLSKSHYIVVAFQKLGKQEWLKTARKKAAWVVERAKENGGYTFDVLPNWLFNPSFLRGTAGVGYQLLRLVSPELLPSVLIWE